MKNPTSGFTFRKQYSDKSEAIIIHDNLFVFDPFQKGSALKYRRETKASMVI